MSHVIWIDRLRVDTCQVCPQLCGFATYDYLM